MIASSQVHNFNHSVAPFDTAPVASPSPYYQIEIADSPKSTNKVFRKTYAHGGDMIRDPAYQYAGADANVNTYSPGGRFFSPEEKQHEFEAQVRRIEMKQQLDDQIREKALYRKKAELEELRKYGSFTGNGNGNGTGNGNGNGNGNGSGNGNEPVNNISLKKAMSEVEQVSNLSKRFNEVNEQEQEHGNGNAEVETIQIQIQQQTKQKQESDFQQQKSNLTIVKLQNIINNQKQHQELELEQLRNQLKAVREGQLFFLESLKATNDNVFSKIRQNPFSPIKKRATTRNKEEDDDLNLGNSKILLQNRREYVPVHGQAGSSLAMGNYNANR